MWAKSSKTVLKKTQKLSLKQFDDGGTGNSQLKCSGFLIINPPKITYVYLDAGGLFSLWLVTCNSVNSYLKNEKLFVDAWYQGIGWMQGCRTVVSFKKNRHSTGEPFLHGHITYNDMKLWLHGIEICRFRFGYFWPVVLWFRFHSP